MSSVHLKLLSFAVFLLFFGVPTVVSSADLHWSALVIWYRLTGWSVVEVITSFHVLLIWLTDACDALNFSLADWATYSRFDWRWLLFFSAFPQFFPTFTRRLVQLKSLFNSIKSFPGRLFAQWCNEFIRSPKSLSRDGSSGGRFLSANWTSTASPTTTRLPPPLSLARSVSPVQKWCWPRSPDSLSYVDPFFTPWTLPLFHCYQTVIYILFIYHVLLATLFLTIIPPSHPHHHHISIKGHFCCIALFLCRSCKRVPFCHSFQRTCCFSIHVLHLLLFRIVNERESALYLYTALSLSLSSNWRQTAVYVCSAFVQQLVAPQTYTHTETYRLGHLSSTADCCLVHHRCSVEMMMMMYCRSISPHPPPMLMSSLSRTCHRPRPSPSASAAAAVAVKAVSFLLAAERKASGVQWASASYQPHTVSRDTWWLIGIVSEGSWRESSCTVDTAATAPDVAAAAADVAGNSIW